MWFLEGWMKMGGQQEDKSLKQKEGCFLLVYSLRPLGEYPIEDCLSGKQDDLFASKITTTPALFASGVGGRGFAPYYFYHSLQDLINTELARLKSSGVFSEKGIFIICFKYSAEKTQKMIREGKFHQAISHAINVYQLLAKPDLVEKLQLAGGDIATEQSLLERADFPFLTSLEDGSISGVSHTQ